MANTTFMKKKYTLEEMITSYLKEIDHLKLLVKTPQDERKRQEYYQAARTFKEIKVKDLVRFALSHGKGEEAGRIKQAFAVLLGDRVNQPTLLDLEYARLLLIYAKSFKVEKGNLKNWMLSVLINSRFSPLRDYIATAIDHVIENTESKIMAYEALL